MIGYIYLIIDLTNLKKYVGQHHYHLEKLDSNYHGSGTIISKIYKKRPHTLKEVYLKTCYTQEELDEWEKYYIKFYNTLYPNGYNLTEGGNGCVACEETRKKISESNKGRIAPNKGKPMSEEQKKKLSESLKGRIAPNKGKPMSEEQKRKLSEINKGKHHSDETKRKMSEKRKGRHHTEESKKKMSESNKGKQFSEEHRRKISESKKNISEETRKKISESRKGIPAPNKGKHHTEESKRKMSEAHKRRFMLKKMQPDGCLPLW